MEVAAAKGPQKEKGEYRLGSLGKMKDMNELTGSFITKFERKRVNQ